MAITGDWLAGFIDGEGCFSINISLHSDGCRVVRFDFALTQYEEAILVAIKDFVGCGEVQKRKHGGWTYRIRRHLDIASKLIPLLEKHGLQSKKRKDYEIWKETFYKFVDRPNREYTKKLIEDICDARERINTKGKHLKRHKADIIRMFEERKEWPHTVHKMQTAF